MLKLIDNISESSDLEKIIGWWGEWLLFWKSSCWSEIHLKSRNQVCLQTENPASSQLLASSFSFFSRCHWLSPIFFHGMKSSSVWSKIKLEEGESKNYFNLVSDGDNSSNFFLIRYDESSSHWGCKVHKTLSSRFLYPSLRKKKHFWLRQQP